MSIIDDYAGIARRLREKQGLPKPKPVSNQGIQAAARQQAAPNQHSNQAQQGIQAADPGHSHQYQQAVRGTPPCSLCFDDGWIAVRRSGLWVGIQCIQCGNPRRMGCPAR